MYDVVIVGAGISGLNTARLISKSYKSICILEKSKNIGGLIQTKYLNIPNHDKKVKIESGGAVVYDYQKNMLQLIKLFNIDVLSIPLNKNSKHHKDFWDSKKRKFPMDKRTTEKFFSLIQKLFSYMETKGDAYCRKYTLEQISLEIFSFQDTRFMEFCYGYASEFRIANSVVAKKNIQNELFNSKNIYIFKQGYNQLIQALYDSIKEHVVILTDSNVQKFIYKTNHIEIFYNNTSIKTKKLVFAIPREALKTMCDSFTPYEHSLFDSVQPSSLTRLYAQYDMSKKNNLWMKKLSFSTINNPIRQIIPVKKNIGFFQISYSDWYFADYWGKLNSNYSKIILKKLLSKTFQYQQIDNPIYFKKFYWPNAIHFWNTNINEKILFKKIHHLRPNLFISGESFSLNQGWCEGAIQSSIHVSKLLLNS